MISFIWETEYMNSHPTLSLDILRRRARCYECGILEPFPVITAVVKMPAPVLGSQFSIASLDNTNVGFIFRDVVASLGFPGRS